MRVRVRRDLKARIRDGRVHAGITPAEEYFVIEINHEEFRVVDDRGEPILYPKGLFDVVDSSLPPGWQFVEYPDGGYQLEPTKTAAPGLYEVRGSSRPEHPNTAEASTNETPCFAS